MAYFIAIYDLEVFEPTIKGADAGDPPSYHSRESFTFQAQNLAEASSIAKQHALAESSPTLTLTLETLSSH